MAHKTDYYHHPGSNRIKRLFWMIAGADRYLLERSTYGDQIKYLCLGGIILATGIMAGLAGGYAFYTIFEPRGNALDFKTVSSVAGTYQHTDIGTAIRATIFGIVWGLIIFNIDRFIVTSTGKGDGTEEITRKELVGALPRIIMGAIIALTISKPVEIRMFKAEIDVKLHEKQIEQEQAYKAKIDSVFNSEIAKKEAEIGKTEELLAAKRKMYDDLQAQYVAESRIVKPGPKAAAVMSQLQSVKADIERIESNSEYIGFKKEKSGIEAWRQKALDESGKVAAGLDGLLERIKLAHEIAGWVISLFITLLFMAIELTPIFFKLMLIKSTYDYLDENVKELIKAEHGIQIEHDFYPDKQGMERDKVVNHQVIKKLKEKIKELEAQTAISEEALEAWQQKKKREAAEHPEAFVTEEQVNGYTAAN
jgi:hypothetical protein